MVRPASEIALSLSGGVLVAETDNTDTATVASFGQMPAL